MSVGVDETTPLGQPDRGVERVESYDDAFRLKAKVMVDH
jgi:hypothetical protein